MIQDQQSIWTRCATQAFRRAANNHPSLGSDAQSLQKGTAASRTLAASSLDTTVARTSSTVNDEAAAASSHRPRCHRAKDELALDTVTAGETDQALKNWNSVTDSALTNGT
jgi:hypothetical protein